MKRNVILLFLASILIYALQLFIFRDPSTTHFYILQDLAFLPISIAVATIAVGEYLDKKEKIERQEKTQMLCSSFYSEMGNELLHAIVNLADEKDDIQKVFETEEVEDYKTLDALRDCINHMSIRVRMTQEAYEQVERIVEERKAMLLILSSNPLLIDHADFTKMLWGLFHLIDEFRLRGEYASLSKSDIAHIENDFTEILKLLLINWSRNRLYTKKNYPNYYSSSVGMIFERR